MIDHAKELQRVSDSLAQAANVRTLLAAAEHIVQQDERIAACHARVTALVREREGILETARGILTQRDDLLAALRQCVIEMEQRGIVPPCLDQAREALARAEGGRA